MARRRAVNVSRARKSSTTVMKDLGMQEVFYVGREISGKPGRGSFPRTLLRTMHQHGGRLGKRSLVIGIPRVKRRSNWKPG